MRYGIFFECMTTDTDVKKLVLMGPSLEPR
jgi:hypothetical protein